MIREHVRTRARQAARIAAFAALTTSMLALFRAHQRATREDARDALRERYLHRWTGALLDRFGVEAIVTRAQRARSSEEAREPNGRRGRLVVANHRSTLDVLTLLHEFGGHIVSRDDLSRWPLVGAAARSVGTVFVDRESATSGVQAIRAMARLLERGHVVTVFPEGTTFPDDEVRPFHKGAFVAAKMAGALIVPVGIAYANVDAAYVDESFAAHMARLAGAERTRVALTIGAELEITGNAERTARLARDRVQALVSEARASLDARPPESIFSRSRRRSP